MEPTKNTELTEQRQKPLNEMGVHFFNRGQKIVIVTRPAGGHQRLINHNVVAHKYPRDMCRGFCVPRNIARRRVAVSVLFEYESSALHINAGVVKRGYLSQKFKRGRTNNVAVVVEFIEQPNVERVAR